MRAVLIALVAAAALALPLIAQTPDPAASYRTVTTQHFRITYTAPLSDLVKPAAERAEEAYALLLRQLVKAPKGRIDLLLSDNSDITNGFAQRLPTNRINIWVRVPMTDLDIEQFRDWLDLVITHELAHIFHLDVAGSVGRALRSVFGRLPYSWPVFPNEDPPRWSIEGLAVEFETRGTGSGRTLGSFHEMVVRTAVIEDRLDPIDRVSGDSRIWPGGSRAYIYGSLFMDYLARKHGPNTQGEIARKTAGSVLPPVLVFNRIGKRALGRSFTDEYESWRYELAGRYGTLLDSLRRIGLTETVRLTNVGRSALFPRISPDGQLVSFGEENGRDAVRTRVIDINTGATRWTGRRNGIAAADWISNGELITAQLDYTDRFSIYSDLFRMRVGGTRKPTPEREKAAETRVDASCCYSSVKRLTRKARYEEVDADASGTRLLAVQTGQGSNRIVLLNGDGKLLRALTPSAYGTAWSLPRWSPNGSRIAVSRWMEGGAYDVVVLDTLGTVVQQATQDEAIDGSPSWSPDGRYILFWSDRTGIPNIFAFDTEKQTLLQVTNLITGAFYPEVSADSRWIVFSAYHHVGYYIEKIPYDPSTWKPFTAPPTAPSAQRARVALDSAAALHVPATVSEPRGYSPWRTALPHYWFPVYDDQGVEGKYYGIGLSGNDLLNRHVWVISGGVDPDNGRTSGVAAYTYNGFHNPALGLQFTRDWDNLGRVRIVRNNGADTALVQTLQREDVGAITATFLRRRFRSSTSLSIGPEIVNRRRVVVNDSARFLDPSDRLYGVFGRIAFANYKAPALSISREDGVLLQVTGRVRVEPDTVQRDRSYRELTTANAVYKSLNVFGFSHHVIGLRGSAAVRTGTGAALLEVGGTPGGSYGLGPFYVGIGGEFLPVRGFREGDRAGNRAWSASAEYRVPLFQVGRGYKLWPFFLERAYISAFGDAGNATCDEAFRARFQVCTTEGSSALLSAGAELGADVGVLTFVNTRARIGLAQPIRGPRTMPYAYLSFGAAF